MLDSTSPTNNVKSVTEVVDKLGLTRKVGKHNGAVQEQGEIDADGCCAGNHAPELVQIVDGHLVSHELVLCARSVQSHGCAAGMNL